MDSTLNFAKLKEATGKALKEAAVKSGEIYKKSQSKVIQIGGPIKASTAVASGASLITIQNALKHPNTKKIAEVVKRYGMISLITIQDAIKHPNTQKIVEVVEKYWMVIAVIPGMRDLLMSILLKATGFTAHGVSGTGLAHLIQSNFYGGFIAKDSLFSYLQSVGATGVFDPTILTLLLLGGTIFYYFYFYSQPYGHEDSFKWKLANHRETSDLITVPQSVSYENGKFNIKWSNL